jgi:hypothetical protein
VVKLYWGWWHWHSMLLADFLSHTGVDIDMSENFHRNENMIENPRFNYTCLDLFVYTDWTDFQIVLNKATSSTWRQHIYHAWMVMVIYIYFHGGWKLFFVVGF